MSGGIKRSVVKRMNSEAAKLVKAGECHEAIREALAANDRKWREKVEGLVKKAAIAEIHLHNAGHPFSYELDKAIAPFREGGKDNNVLEDSE